MNPNLSLSSDYLHLANDNSGASGLISIPANVFVPAYTTRSWQADFSVPTKNGAFTVPWFECSLPGLEGKIFSQGFDIWYENPFVLSLTKISGVWRFRIFVPAWGTSVTLSNPAFTVRAGIKTLVVT